MLRKILFVAYSLLGFVLYALAAMDMQGEGAFSLLAGSPGPSLIARGLLLLAAGFYLLATMGCAVRPFAFKALAGRKIRALLAFVWLSLVPLYLAFAGYSSYLIASISEPRIHDIPRQSNYWLSLYQVFYGPSNTGELLYRMANANLGEPHDYKKAKWCLEKAAFMLESAKNGNRVVLANVLRKQAYVNEKLGKDIDAIADLRRAYTLSSAKNCPDALETKIAAAIAIANWDFAAGKFAEAKSLYQAAAKNEAEAYGKSNKYTMAAVAELAHADYRLHDFADAEKLYTQVIDFVSGQPLEASGRYPSLYCGKNEINFPTLLYRYSEVLNALHKNAEANLALMRAHKVVDMHLVHPKFAENDACRLSEFGKQVTEHLLDLRYNTKDFRSAKESLLKHELAASALSQLNRFLAPQAMAQSFWLLGRWPTPKQDIQVKYTAVSVDPPKSSELAGVHIEGNVLVKNSHALQKSREEDFVFTYAVTPALNATEHPTISHFWFVDGAP